VSAVHVIPRDDLIDHTAADDCPCGPRSEGWLLVHASLDGREAHE
jgi:hypothetical protein